MRVFCCLVAAAMVMVVQGGLRAKPRTLHLGKRTHGEAAGLSSKDCDGQIRSCASCTTVLQCARLGNIYRPLNTTECPRGTPYCSAGTCVASLPDDSCVAPPRPSSAFECNGDGYYPDPSNCRRYWMCVGHQAYLYSCYGLAGTVYSHRRAMCVSSSEATCTTVSCSNALVGAYQRYAQDPEVYVVCRDAVAANALVAACPPNFTVDTATGDCVLTCLAEGRLADRENHTRYYECTSRGNTYSPPLLLQCPTGSVFSQEKQRCLTGSENAVAPNSSEKGYDENYYAPDANVHESEYNIPSTMKIGAASAAYQIEGAWNNSDKSPSIQDVFYHSHPAMANGDVADDSYHKYMDDIKMLKQLRLHFYRFSISWPRLIPEGNMQYPSVEGVQYYNNLIHELLKNNIEPVVTLYHWDLPQTFQNDGGWLNPSIQQRFVDYATFCFKTFGDRVKTWILFNEPMSQCVSGYDNGKMAPGVQLPGTGAYLCSHNMVLAAAKAYRVYKALFALDQQGIVGNAMNIRFGEPESSSQADIDAAERYNVWQYAWFADPLYFGDYPSQMRSIVDNLSAQEGRTESRLPRFTPEEREILTGAMDFLGINTYAAIMVGAPASPTSSPASPSYSTDMQVVTRVDLNWTPSARDIFPVTPFGLADSVRWLRDRYNNFPVWVTENGYAGAKDEGIHDQKRVGYYSGYMRGLMQAVNRDRCNVIGYTAWSLDDNLEWNDGYSLKFGLVYVDMNDPNRTRTLKDSGAFFQSVMTTRHVPYVERT